MKTIIFNKANWTGETSELKAFKTKVKVPELNMEISFKEVEIEEDIKELLSFNVYEYTLIKWDGKETVHPIGEYTGSTPEEAHEKMAQTLFNRF